MLNNIQLMGRLTAAPELKKTEGDVSYLNFSIAVNRPKNKEGEIVADFINCTAWRHTAEFISKYFTKGQLILVQGELRQQTYKDKEGKTRTTYVVIPSSVDFCGDAMKKAETKAKEEVTPQEEFSVDDSDEDLPF